MQIPAPGGVRATTQTREFESPSFLGRARGALATQYSLGDRRPMPQQQLTIGLLKPGAFETHVLPKLAEWDEENVTCGGTDVGSLFVPKAVPKRARWATFFDAADTNPVAKCNQTLRSALFVVDAGGRTFVLPFGVIGRHAVPTEALEEHFGRNVTLNSVDPERLRVVDNVRIEAENRHARLQLGRAGSFLAFDIDHEQDLVRSIGGEPSDTSFGSRVAGSVYLTLQTDVALAELETKLLECLARFASNAYKATFDYLDALTPVRDPARIAFLNTLMLARVSSDAAPGRAWLAVPDVIEWNDLAGFAFRSKPKDDQVFPDLFLRRFREHIGAQPITEKLLKSRRAYLIRADGTPGMNWSVHQCVYAEVEDGDSVFVLTDGKWYQVHKTLAQNVNAYVKSLPTTSIALPAWKAGDSEAAFNSAIVAANSAHHHLLDADPVPYGGAHQKIEVCDVFAAAAAPVLLHAKAYSSSKPLSHLFAQGANSAELLLEPDFLAAARKKFPCLPKKWSAMGAEIAFVVGSHSKKPLDLPFFSRVTLRAAAKRLQRLGYSVTLTRVAIA